MMNNATNESFLIPVSKPLYPDSPFLPSLVLCPRSICAAFLHSHGPNRIPFRRSPFLPPGVPERIPEISPLWLHWSGSPAFRLEAAGRASTFVDELLELFGCAFGTGSDVLRDGSGRKAGLCW